MLLFKIFKAYINLEHFSRVGNICSVTHPHTCHQFTLYPSLRYYNAASLAHVTRLGPPPMANGWGARTPQYGAPYAPHR